MNAEQEIAVAGMKARAEELYRQGRGVQAHFISMIAFEIENGASWYEIMRQNNVPIPAPEETN